MLLTGASAPRVVVSQQRLLSHSLCPESAPAHADFALAPTFQWLTDSPLTVLAAVIWSCSLPFLLLSLLWFASPPPFSCSLQFKLHFCLCLV